MVADSGKKDADCPFDIFGFASGIAWRLRKVGGVKRCVISLCRPYIRSISIHPSETVSVHSQAGLAGDGDCLYDSGVSTITLMGSLAFGRVDRPRMKMAAFGRP